MDAGKVRVLYEADTKEFERANKKVQTDMERLVSNAKKIGGALGLAFGAREILQYGIHVVNTVGNLQDLANQTGISASTLSGLKATIEQNGASLERFGKAILFAQRSLGQAGDAGKRAAEALGALGLNVDELRQATGEEFLEKFAKALSQVRDQNARAAIAFRVMGDAGAELIPVLLELSQNFDQLKNSGLSPETITAIDDIGDAFTRLSNTLLNLSARGMAAFLREIGLAKRSAAEIQRDLDATVMFAPGDIGKIQRLERELAEARERVDDKDRAGFPSARFKFADNKAIEEAAKRNAAFAASLKEANNNLQQQLIGLIAGPDAAEAYAIEILEAKAAVDGLTTAEKEQLARHQRLLENLREKTDAYRDLAQSVEETRDDVRFSLEEESSFLGRTRTELEEATAAWEEYRRTVLAAVEATKDDPRFSLDEEEIRFGVDNEGLEAARQANAAAGAPGQFAQGLGQDIVDPFRSAIQQLMSGSKNFENVFAHAVGGIFLNVSARILEENAFKPLEKALTNLIQTMIQNVMGSISGGSSGGGSDWIGALLGIGTSLIGGFFGVGGGMGLAGGMGLGSTMASGGASFPLGLPSFHEGGLVDRFKSLTSNERLARLQAGEFVLSRAATAAIGARGLDYMNETGRMPMAGGFELPATRVEINGDITPRKPGMSKDEVVRIILQDHATGGPLRESTKKIISR